MLLIKQKTINNVDDLMKKDVKKQLKEKIMLNKKYIII